jgi:tetratricopeptide (TPR) repeat protein
MAAASRRAWLGANVERAREDARTASIADDTSAAAHLAAIVAMPFWPDDETRTHFVRAQELRTQLAPIEREMLTALAPAITIPPDFHRSAELLAALAAKTSDTAVHVTTADMWMRVGDLDRAQALLAPLAEPSDAPAIALSELAAVQSHQDNLDGARATLARCLDRYPGARLCSEQLSWLELLEGKCAVAETVVRKELSIAPSADGYLRLAHSLYGRGTSAPEIRAVLDKWAALTNAEMRPINQLRVERRIALLEGHLSDAMSADARIGNAMAGIDDDSEQFDFTLYSMLLNVEAGRRPDATGVLDRYVTSRHGLRRNAYGGDNVMYLEAVGAEIGIVPWKQWVERRDKALAQPQERDGMLDGRARTWLEYYAMPATTPEAAREALAVLPKFPKLLNRAERWYWHDGAIGRVYQLAGRNAEAIPFFERAANACTGLEDVVQHTRVLLDYATLVGQTGDKKLACALYDRVLHSSPLGAGGESSARAELLRKRALCAPQSR